jgi:mRNA-degrading endonuclease RelE of RelBE toxin-antitoxin system
MKYAFHPEAEQELHEAAVRYESEVSELGLRFVDEVERVIHLAIAHGSREPGYWRPRVQDR